MHTAVGMREGKLTIERDGGDFVLKAEQWIPQSVEDTFAFFGDAGNLEDITPPWLHFEIVTPRPIVMKPGALIDYRLKLHGLPLRWRTEISVWEPSRRFVDRQLKGPYRLWVHEHRFEARDGGTWMHDEVRYRSIGGRLVNWLFVSGDLHRIFQYRRDRIAERLGA